jgi:hypothetical protein
MKASYKPFLDPKGGKYNVFFIEVVLESHFKGPNMERQN